jgi:hypothetical protein
MEQVDEAIVKAQYQDMVTAIGEEEALKSPLKSVVFVRYNPDGRELDGFHERLDKKKNEARLFCVLSDIDSGDIAFDKPLNIVYINYDMRDGEPVVFGDVDFYEQMRACVAMAI